MGFFTILFGNSRQSDKQKKNKNQQKKEKQEQERKLWELAEEYEEEE